MYFVGAVPLHPQFKYETGLARMALCAIERLLYRITDADIAPKLIIVKDTSRLRVQRSLHFLELVGMAKTTCGLLPRGYFSPCELYTPV